jgi:hypothetical protein
MRLQGFQQASWIFVPINKWLMQEGLESLESGVWMEK